MTLSELQYKYGNIAGSAYSTFNTCYNSYSMGKHVNDNLIEGDIVECGLAAGSNFAFMMIGCDDSKNQLNRTYWGFDSFQGIQLGNKKDVTQPGIGLITHNTDVSDEDLLVSSGITSYSKQQVVSNLSNWNMLNHEINLIEGWIQKSLTDSVISQISKIAVLRLDMDMYDPTKFALNKLYPLVSEGGVIIIDDWALPGARAACEEFFQENQIIPKINSIPDTTPIFFFKGQ